MGNWKRLHRSGENEEVDVNLDNVIYLQAFTKYTILYFAVPIGERLHTLYVKETPNEIHLAKLSLPSTASSQPL